jgi:hypothetical protein
MEAQVAGLKIEIAAGLKVDLTLYRVHLISFMMY